MKLFEVNFMFLCYTFEQFFTITANSSKENVLQSLKVTPQLV